MQFERILKRALRLFDHRIEGGELPAVMSHIAFEFVNLRLYAPLFLPILVERTLERIDVSLLGHLPPLLSASVLTLIEICLSIPSGGRLPVSFDDELGYFFEGAPVFVIRQQRQRLARAVGVQVCILSRAF